jgi:hypothetical protein
MLAPITFPKITVLQILTGDIDLDQFNSRLKLMRCRFRTLLRHQIPHQIRPARLLKRKFGTRPGVAYGMKPPVWLKDGGPVTLGIDGLGTQMQKIVPFKM